MARNRSDAPPLMTIADVAARWQTVPRTVQRLVARGELRAIKIGRLIRFDPEDVAAVERR